jgi:hypothetical protein
MIELSSLYLLGDKPLDHEAHLTLVPIHVVTHASQLPTEFLEPSIESKLVIGFDCEGVDLCRHGTLCIMQVNLIPYSIDVIILYCKSILCFIYFIHTKSATTMNNNTDRHKGW